MNCVCVRKRSHNNVPFSNALFTDVLNVSYSYMYKILFNIVPKKLLL